MKLILIHVPKTAGNAILKTYPKAIDKNWGHNTRSLEFVTYPDYKLKESNKVLNKIKLFLNNQKKSISFAVVRNSWDRVFSSYNYLTRGGLEKGDNDDYIKYIKPYRDFNDFVEQGLEKAFNEQIHFRSQLFWIANNSNEIIVDHVLHFENVNNDMKLLMEKYSLPQKDLVVYNKRGNLNYKDIYTEKSIKKVGAIYSKEIQKFSFQY